MELSLALNLLLGLWPGASPSAPAKAAGATSVTRTFTASQDNWIDDSNQTFNYGGATTMNVVKGGAGKRGRTLVKFDVSAVPSTATVSAGTLSLTQTATVTGRTLGTHKVTTTWTEGTGTGSATANGATWATTNGATAWTTAGGDFTATATGTYTTTATPTTATWTVTTDVSSFVATASSNFGWLIKDGTEANPQSTVSTFHSRTGTTVPSLSATFTAVWDSYSDSGRTAQSDSLTAANQENVYMRGTGFNLGGSYIIAYYDSTGFKACTDTIAASAGTLDSSCRLIAGSTLAAGTWHAVVFDPTGSAATTYASISETVNKPLADDTFTVNASALVPELPSLLATALVMALAAAIYTWFTSRPLAAEAVAL